MRPRAEAGSSPGLSGSCRRVSLSWTLARPPACSASPSPPAPRAPSPPAPPTAGRPSLGPHRWHPRPPGHTPARARPPPTSAATCATRTLDSGHRPLVLPSVVRGPYFPSPLSVHPLLAADQSYWAGQLRGRRPARNVSPGDGASRAGAGLPGLFLPRGPTSASPHPGHAGDCTAGHPGAREQGRGGRQRQPPRESQTQPQTLVAGAQTPPRGRPRTRELPPPAGTCWPVVRPAVRESPLGRHVGLRRGVHTMSSSMSHAPWKRRGALPKPGKNTGTRELARAKRTQLPQGPQAALLRAGGA